MTATDFRETTLSVDDRAPSETDTSSITIARFHVDASDFGLEETLDSFPDATFECERGVESVDGALMPLVWARDVERSGLGARLDADTSVERARLVEDCGSDRLYHVEWAGTVRTIARMLTEGAISVREARLTDGRWSLEVLFPSRTCLSRAYRLCEDFGVNVDVTMVRKHTGKPEDRFGLTEQQLTALRTAFEHGYFEIPKATDLDGVAEHLGLTHQALSERMRRGQGELIESTIVERRL